MLLNRPVTCPSGSNRLMNGEKTKNKAIIHEKGFPVCLKFMEVLHASLITVSSYSGFAGALTRQEVGYTLNRFPAHHQRQMKPTATHTHSYVNVELPVN